MKHPFALALLAAVGCGLFTGADWHQFRGSDNRSVSPDANVPTSWDAETHIGWKVELPGRGPSSPIVVRDRVVVTCSGGVRQDRLYVVCFSADDGRQLWKREFWATGSPLSHPDSANAAPTPASDGQRIFAFYSSNDLVCLDLDGNLLWYRGLSHDYPQARNDVGMSSSPLAIGQTVVVQVENQGDSFAAGLDSATGEERWRIPRPAKANWASPTLLPGGQQGRDLVLLQSSEGLTAHDPSDGRVVWQHEARCGGIPSVATTPEALFVPANGLTRLDLNGSEPPTVAWEVNRLGPSSASPVVHQGRVYTLARGGILKCGDIATGEELWVERLGGTFWATPVVAGKHLYCINYEGEAKVVELGDQPQRQVTASQFGEKIQGTPAVAGNALFVRSDQHLWKITQ